jgi:hypothetical protein
MFYRLHFIIQQRSREHFNLLILLRCKFNNFVTLAQYKDKTPWRWCKGVSKHVAVLTILHIYIYIVSGLNNKNLLRYLQRHISTYHQGNLIIHKHLKYVKFTAVSLMVTKLVTANKFRSAIQAVPGGLLCKYSLSKFYWWLRLLLGFFQPTKTGSSPATTSVF